MQEQEMKQGRLVSGRQVLFMIYQDFQVSQVAGFLMDWTHLQNIKLINDDLHKFVCDWDTCLASIPEDNLPDPKILKDLFKAQLDNSQQLKQVMSLYHINQSQKGEVLDYDQWRTVVQNHLNAQSLQRNQAGMKASVNTYGITPAAQQTPEPPLPPMAPATVPYQRRAGICDQYAQFGRCSRDNDPVNWPNGCPYTHEPTDRPPGANDKGGGKKGGGRKSDGKKGDGKKGDGKKGDGKKGKGSPGKGAGSNAEPETEPKAAYNPAAAPKAPGTPTQKSATANRGTSPSGKPDAEPCPDWNRGACPRGTNCDLHHGTRKCSFFARNACLAGDKCRFRHILANAAPVVKQPETEEAKPAKPKRRSKSERARARKGVGEPAPIGTLQCAVLCLSVNTR